MGVSAPAVLNRAYSLLEVRSVDDEQRLIEGIATTPSTDRMEDVIESEGAEFKLPIPLLWQHRHDQPIGHVLSANVSPDGIHITARIAKGVLPRIEEAWTLIKSGLVRGLSIGFRPLADPEPIKGTYGLRFKRWEWLELSAVTIPANADASISVIKQFDTSPADAGGTVARSTTATAVATSRVVKATSLPATAMKTIQEQKAAFQATRETKANRMTELMTKAADAGVTLDENESTE